LARLNIVSSALSTVLGWAGFGASMTASPETPVQTPALWTLLAFARREIEQTVHRTPAAAQPQASALTVDGPNLLVNPGAEIGDPSLSGYSSVTVPGWTVTGTPTVIEYGTLRRFPWPTASPGPTFPAFLGFPTSASAPPDSGAQFFGGGPVATSTLTQIVNLARASGEINQGNVPYELTGDLGGFLIDPSAASVTVKFLDVDGNTLGSGRIRPVTAIGRGFQTGLVERETSGTIPVGTVSAQVIVTFTDRNPVLGNYNNAYADNVSFTVGVADLAPAPLTPPASTVGQLDHLFMVYMENKGLTDIVGSRNAPYLNSLINTYGFGSNYYALTHPSDPNYYPILGGSDFGINYNCPANCFDEPNLADSIEVAKKTWAGYMVGGGGFTTPTDRLPFLAFSDIYNDPARVAAHLFDLSQLGPDLASTATAPNFVWFAADDATNMEGPTDTLLGIIRWALSQLTTHQYNVAAGDEWLQDTIPVIMNSPVWNDPTQKSAIVITFDEDYNNLSLGIGNQGNHIVTVVIPSPGAVASGMRDGHFVADDYNNHYSLLRTIEDSLGLPPLTNNDRFAEPMNDYWV
jgi:Phosphoesterase family